MAAASSRSKRRRIHDNVEKALLAIAQDSTHSATPTDVTGYVDGKTVLHENDLVQYSAPSPSTSADAIGILPTDYSSSNGGVYADDQDVAEIFSSNECSDDSDELNDDCLADDIAHWFKECSIPQVHLGSLLTILKKYHPSLPKDPRTLLETVREVSVKDMGGGGSYHHLGVKKVLQNMWNRGLLRLPADNQQLLLQVNMDGLQLFKSSGYQFWPILGSVVNALYKHVFEIGLYGGYKKPADIAEFLCDFVSETKQLEDDGITLGGVTYSFAIHSIVCDAPARSYIKCVKPHNSYSSCERCTEVGKWVSGRVTFPTTDKPLRTDHSFRNMTDEDHHVGKSPLTALSIDMITQFPLDEMHLVYLGVVRRLIIYWLRGPIEYQSRLPGRAVQTLSKHLLCLQQHICNDFARKPRSLAEVDRWKATEFRLFLLYLGPIILNGVLPVEHYRHFLLLHVAIYCLTSSRLCSSHIDYAQKLLLRFVGEAPSLYGAEFVVYNVHSLIHICDDARIYKRLQDVNAFKYECHMKKLKKLVHHPQNPLKQAVKRILEKQNVAQASDKHDSSSNRGDSIVGQHEHSSGPICSSVLCIKQFSKLFVKSFQVVLNRKNNCVMFANGDIGLVCNIVQNHNGEIFVLYEQFKKITSFFDYPCKSEDLGYCFKASHLEHTLFAANAATIATKCLCLPHEKDVFVVMPLCHVN